MDNKIVVDKQERIALLERTIESIHRSVQRMRDKEIVPSSGDLLLDLNVRCEKLGFSWELSYDNGRRIEGQYLSDGHGNMIPSDEVERLVKAGEIPITVDHNERGIHASVAQWGANYSFGTLLAAVKWMLGCLLVVCEDEFKELTDGDPVSGG